VYKKAVLESSFAHFLYLVTSILKGETLNLKREQITHVFKRVRDIQEAVKLSIRNNIQV